MAVDPAKDSMRPESPQSWNRYTYGLNNPIRFNDPRGLAEDDPSKKPAVGPQATASIKNGTATATACVACGTTRLTGNDSMAIHGAEATVTGHATLNPSEMNVGASGSVTALSVTNTVSGSSVSSSQTLTGLSASGEIGASGTASGNFSEALMGTATLVEGSASISLSVPLPGGTSVDISVGGTVGVGVSDGFKINAGTSGAGADTGRDVSAGGSARAGVGIYVGVSAGVTIKKDSGG